MQTRIRSSHFNIHLYQFSHSEDGGITFLRNIGTYNDYTAQKSKRRPLIWSTTVMKTCKLMVV
jgi:hypothetical protein